MGAPSSLFKTLTGFARDYPRDRMPEGYVWDLADYVPVLLDTALTQRGGWKWFSNAAPANIEGGIYAPYKSGDRLLIVSNGALYEVNQSTGAVTAVTGGGGLAPIKQNPVMLKDTVVVFDGVSLPKYVNATSSAITVTSAPASAFPFKYGMVYKSRVVGANYPGSENVIRFSKVADPTQAWNADSQIPSSGPLTGIGALRAVILLFHAGTVERIRGSTPPDSQDNTDGDMNLEGLFDRCGCGDARSIAYWNDNCIFADERGCHLTDGAVVKNLISQGGLVTFWRVLFQNRQTITACTYLDYYIITVVRTDGIAVTLVCDLNRRAWFRFTNIKATCYIQSVGVQERIWMGIEPDHRLASLTECFFPTLTPSAIVQDANSVPVLPVMETPWYRLGNEGRKRTRFVYASYDIRIPPGATAMGWRSSLGEPEDLNRAAVTAVQQMLDVGYVINPNEPPTPDPYTSAGRLPSTGEYRRYRLPINRHPYGIAFRLKQITPSTVTRIYDFAVDANAEERSRV